MDIRRLKTAEELGTRIRELITLDELSDLTAKGICPHYKLINPSTEKEIFLYDSAELMEWVNKYMLKYFPSSFEPQITIYEYNQTLIGTGECNMPPAELVDIRNLLHLPISKCTTPPGIYFLVRQNKVVYVGQSINVLNRITTHIAEGLKDFETAFFIPVPANHLDKIEQAFIKTLRPVYNQNIGPTRDSHREVVETFKLTTNDFITRQSQ